jgi:hypothetical protein
VLVDLWRGFGVARLGVVLIELVGQLFAERAHRAGLVLAGEAHDGVLGFGGQDFHNLGDHRDMVDRQRTLGHGLSGHRKFRGEFAASRGDPPAQQPGIRDPFLGRAEIPPDRVPQHLRQILVTELTRSSAPIQLGDLLQNSILANPNLRHLIDESAQQLIGGEESGFDHVFHSIARSR